MGYIKEPSPSNNGHQNNSLLIIVIIIGVLILVLLAFLGGYFIFKENGNNDTIAVDPEKKTETIMVKQEKVVTVPSTKPVSEASATRGVWKNGENFFNGTFYYNGGAYGFSLIINYNTSTGRVISAKYAPTSTNKFATVKGTCSVSDDGTYIYISGYSGNVYTEFEVDASRGSRTFSGSLVRGDHYGTCSMTLR